MKIGVIGCGNVGFSHLVWLNKQGFSVIGLDSLSSVKNRISLEFGNKCVANTMMDLIDCDSIHICVPTEPAKDGSADLSIYEEVIFSLLECLNNVSHPISIVQRSTCPPGSADKYAKLFRENVSYGVNPSFLRKASITQDTDAPERIAIGGTGQVVNDLKKIYSTLNAPYYESPKRSAVELLKYVENTIDSLLISYWNDILRYASMIGLETNDFIQLMEHIGDRPKFNSVVRVPGKAFGMWCLPKDLNALIICMEKLNLTPHTLKGSLITNFEMVTKEGYGDVPAQSLWNCSKKTHILPEGVSQIEKYMNKNGSH